MYIYIYVYLCIYVYIYIISYIYVVTGLVKFHFDLDETNPIKQNKKELHLHVIYPMAMVHLQSPQIVLARQKLFFRIQALVVTAPINGVCHTCLILIVETWSWSYPKCQIREFDCLLMKCFLLPKDLPDLGKHPRFKTITKLYKRRLKSFISNINFSKHHHHLVFPVPLP